MEVFKMGFFQDLKQDLSQTVSELEGVNEEGIKGEDINEENVSMDDIDLSDINLDDINLDSIKLDADNFDNMNLEDIKLEDSNEDSVKSDDVDIAALLNDLDSLDSKPLATEAETTENVSQVENVEVAVTPEEPTVEPTIEPGYVLEEVKADEPANVDIENIEVQDNIAEGEGNMEMEELLKEVELNVEEPELIEEPTVEANAEEVINEAVSSDTAVITEGMTITGDIISSGNMDLIGTVTGNIEILGKLNITGTVTGNSSAAEIYAESAQINGEVKSKGSVKIGQSSVIIGDIFATSAVIAGAVKGDIDVHGPVILDTSAIVMGNIKSKSVQINNGAVIEGMCSQCYADVSPSSFFNDVKKNRTKTK
jgi:cytoskeletal protein CcmA (bactofilin family)